MIFNIFEKILQKYIHIYCEVLLYLLLDKAVISLDCKHELEMNSMPTLFSSISKGFKSSLSTMWLLTKYFGAYSCHIIKANLYWTCLQIYLHHLWVFWFTM